MSEPPDTPCSGPPPVVAMGGACVLFKGDGRVLLVRHTYGRLNWELPGGAAEPGESPAETAVREIREETGLRVELVAYWSIDRLPTPISDFTERRIRDGARGSPATVARVDRRSWRT